MRYLEFLSLGTWLGALMFLSFAVAPGAFATLGSRDLAGAVVGMSLGRLHAFGIVAGIVFLVARSARVVLSGGSRSALASPAAILVLAMILLTLFSQYAVSARLAQLKLEMGSLDRALLDHPLRIAFNRLHRVSVWLESGVLLCGLAALFFTVRDKAF